MGLGETIRKYRESKGWSESDLAKVVGLSQPAVHNIEAGKGKKRPKTPKKIREIVRALEIPESELPAHIVELLRPYFIESDTKHFVDNHTPYSLTYDFPVYYSAGATSGQHGAVIVSAEPVEYLERPTPLIKVRDSYGVRVSGTSMEPAYWAGDVVFVHPYLHAAADSDILLRTESHGEQRAMVKYLVRQTDSHWHLRQWNPAPGEKQDFVVLKADWPRADRIVGKYNRR